MSMSTTQLAERYGCVSMTLEMPFKDNFDLPDEVYGWSPQRSKYLAFACLDALHAILPELKARRSPSAPDRHARKSPPDANARAAAARPVAVEFGKPLHRLVGRRSFPRRGRGSSRGGQAAARQGLRLRLLLHERTHARNPNATSGAARNGPAVAAGDQGLAPQRAPLWRAHRAQQAGDDREGRRRAGQDLAPVLRHPAAAAGARQQV